MGVPDEENQNASGNNQKNEFGSSVQPPAAPTPRSVYSRGETYWIVAMASIAALFSTISSPIYLPAIPTLTDYFNTTTEKINLTVTMYSIFQGLSPSIWCPLSDALGRRPVYLGCVIVYIGANIGLALSKNYAMLFVFRCLQSGGIASTVAIGSGVVADITPRHTRGYFIGIFSGCSLVGNAFGPMIGGAIDSSLGWRAIFWFLVIAACVMLIVLGIGMPETHRTLVHDGSLIPWRLVNKSPYIYIRRRFLSVPNESAPPDSVQVNKIDLMLSIRMFKFVDVIIMLIPASLMYTTWFMILTAQASLLDTEYHFSTSQSGFSYLASGLGGLIGSFVSGKIMSWYYLKQKRAELGDDAASTTDSELYNSDNDEEEDGSFNIIGARLGLAWYPAFGVIGSALMFGWTIEYKVHYIVPLLATAIGSFCSVFYMNLTSTLLVDIFPGYSASSSACLNLSRCLICAAGLAAVDSMVRSLGAGGAFTIMAGICALSLGLVYLELKVGPRLYQKRLASMKNFDM